MKARQFIASCLLAGYVDISQNVTHLWCFPNFFNESWHAISSPMLFFSCSCITEQITPTQAWETQMGLININKLSSKTKYQTSFHHSKMVPNSRVTGEGHGTPLQYSCLENPVDGGAWYATVHGVRRVGHDWATSLSLFTFMHWRRKWQPTPVFLPGESQGRRSLVGCRLWGRTKSDTTEVT